MTTAADAMTRLGDTIGLLDALAERENQPRWYTAPRPAEHPFWSFSDGRVLFRMPACTDEGASIWPSSYGIDLARWVAIDPATAPILASHGNNGLRDQRTARYWRRLCEPRAALACAFGAPENALVPDLDVVWVYPPAIAMDARLFWLALIPARSSDMITLNANVGEPVWLYAEHWSAAIAHLRTPLPHVRTESVITLLT